LEVVVVAWSASSPGACTEGGEVWGTKRGIKEWENGAGVGWGGEVKLGWSGAVKVW